MKKIKVDQDKCIGCGTCVALAPKSFKLTDECKSEPIDPPAGEAGPAGDDEAAVREAVESCPVEAIKLT